MQQLADGMIARVMLLIFTEVRPVPTIGAVQPMEDFYVTNSGPSLQACGLYKTTDMIVSLATNCLSSAYK